MKTYDQPDGYKIGLLTGQTRASASQMAILGALVLLIVLAHWWTPIGSHYWHTAHLILRKLFFVPVVMAAVWFNLRGALMTASLVTVLYMPHIVLQWSGQYSENLNQLGELVTVWFAAVLGGTLVGMEKRALQETADAHEGALVALVCALDAREHDTQSHSVRVCAYSERIARALGMSERDIVILKRAALLHDVGKIGVPDEVLLKPDTLTDEDWRLMREHPSIGRRILGPVAFLNEAAEIVFTHHEKFDGTGYPERLSGEDIPLGARVFAVVDAFDALISDRPYQGRIPYVEAVDRIRQGSGVHFDPVVVDAFLAIPEHEWERIATSVEPTAHA